MIILSVIILLLVMIMMYLSNKFLLLMKFVLKLNRTEYGVIILLEWILLCLSGMLLIILSEYGLINMTS